MARTCRTPFTDQREPAASIRAVQEAAAGVSVGWESVTCGGGTARSTSEERVMENYRVTWVRAEDSRPMVSGVSYDRPSAEHRKAALEAEGAADIEIVKVKPGQ